MIHVKADSKNRQAFIKIANASDNITYEIEKAYWEVGKMMSKDLKAGLKRGSNRTGNPFKYNTRILRASRKGEYPQRRTGNLRENVGFTVFSYKRMFFGIEADAEYAKYLEDNRLLVGHTVKKTRKEQENILRMRINTAVKR